MVVNRFEMRESTLTYNLGGMGCSSSVIAVDLAKHLLTVRARTRHACSKDSMQVSLGSLDLLINTQADWQLCIAVGHQASRFVDDVKRCRRGFKACDWQRLLECC